MNAWLAWMRTLIARLAALRGPIRRALAIPARAVMAQLKSWGAAKTGIAFVATLAILTSLGFTAFLLVKAPTAHAAVGGCKDPSALGTILASNDGLQASFVDNGAGAATYSFSSNNEIPSGGVPGLIEYCVYPSSDPGSASASYDSWDSTVGSGVFQFGRPDGNPSNLPFDGTTHTIGTATWSGSVPTSQTIVLHINDADECNQLYGGDPGTCFVTPGSPQTSASPPTVTKDASGSYTDTYTWTVDKSASPKTVDPGGTVNYTVTVTHDSGTISNASVSGTITVTNPNSDAVQIDSVTDKLSDGTVCTVTNGGSQSLPSGDTTFAYSCAPSWTSAPSSIDNKATVSWSDQTLSGGSSLTHGSANYTFSNVPLTANLVDNCVTVSDTNPNGPQNVQVCVGTDPNPKTFTYSQFLTPPSTGCTTVPNTASVTTPSGAPVTPASASVQDCNSGALTMGFWQNTNGQNIIKAADQTSLKNFLTGYNPFKDYPQTSGQTIAQYVYGVIKAATCGGTTCNSMLKAQMLATALDVYFSDPANGNPIHAPSPIGGLTINLQKVCAPASTPCTYIDVSSAFASASGTPKSETVLTMLSDASALSNSGGSMWYGQVKATQVLAKDAFDAINNQVALGV